MVEFLALKINPDNDDRDAGTGVRVGHIAKVLKDGLPMVDFEGNPRGPLPARSIIRIAPKQLGVQILLAFENNDLRNPVIVGILQTQAVVAEPNDAPDLNRDPIDEITIDGEKLVLNAKKEIEIRCGKSALIMKADGKVVIKGDQLISRARRVNKIKGAAVKIN